MSLSSLLSLLLTSERLVPAATLAAAPRRDVTPSGHAYVYVRVKLRGSTGERASDHDPTVAKVRVCGEPGVLYRCALQPCIDALMLTHHYRHDPPVV